MIDSIMKMIKEVDEIITEYQEKANESGENFNLFNILEIESWENGHSKILAELLNPKGSHGQEDLFLKLFTKQFRIKDFDTNSVIVKTNIYIGAINDDYTQGGEIDILIEDEYKNLIIIENKIYAVDQKNQLLRYFNYGQAKGKSFTLFYLNLFGGKPSLDSIGKLEKGDYEVISYENDVIQWLENCKQETPNSPVVREVISQYINVLKGLTNQSIKNKMSEEIKNLIKEKPEYVKSIESAYFALMDICTDVENLFGKKIAEKMPNLPNEIWREGELTIKVSFGEDGDGTWFGYQLFRNDENISSSSTADIYKSKLEGIITNKGHNVESNGNYIAWFYPQIENQEFNTLKGKKIKDLKWETIIELTDEQQMENFVELLIQQEKEIREEFISK